MNAVHMPGFTAETSLNRTKYRMIAVHGSPPGAGAVVPQAPVCSPCSNFLVGKRTCCDIKVGRGPQGEPVISVGACNEENCGLLSDLVGIFT